MRNSLLVAAIVAALGLGGALWYALAPTDEEMVAGAPAPSPAAAARPGESGGQGQGQGQGQTQQPSSQVADSGGTASEPAAAPAGSETQMAAAPATPPAAAQPTDNASAAGAPAAAPAAEPAPEPPSFDIVRVEKDGSAVIAGRAPPGSTITLLDGATPLGSAKAGPDGSFALVLDQPLAPGSRALSLAATTPDGTTVPSTGEVVVVVPEPAPVATAAAAAPAATETAAVEAAASTESASTETTGTETTSTETASTEAASTETAGTETTSTETASTETAAMTEAATTNEAASTEAASTEAASTEETAEETASTEAVATTATAATTEAAAAAVPAPAPAPAPVPAPAPATPLVVATSPTGASVVLQAPGDLTGDTLRIEAVDYDLQGQVIVSGHGPAGGAVALYLDGALLGQTQADAKGRWVFVPGSPVASGLHRLRADLLAADGKVLARAEIPFSRAEPIQLAANEDFVIVQPGNSLWVIARGKYGEGIRYSTIYEANAGQIRDPDLIYPGQIFLVPQVN